MDNPWLEALTDRPVIEQQLPIQFVGTTGRSARNNNPLNLEYRPGSYQDKYGAVLEPTGGGKDKKPRFAKFKTMMDGYLAGLDQIRLDAARGHTLKTFVEKFAPRHENPTDQLIQQYAKALGVSPNTPLSEIPPEKLIVPMLKRESSTRIVTANQAIAQSQDDNPWQAALSVTPNVAQLQPMPEPEPETPSEPTSIFTAMGDLLGPQEAKAAETPPVFQPQEENVWLNALPKAPIEEEPSALPDEIPSTLPVTDLSPPKPKSSEEIENDYLSMMPLTAAKDFDGIAALKAEVAGAPLYEWLLWSGLMLGMPVAGTAAAQGLVNAAKLARFFGPHAANFLSNSIGIRMLGLGLAGAGITGAREALSSLGIYHPWGDDETPPEGLWRLLEPSSFIMGHHPEASLGEKMLRDAIDWASLEPLISGFKGLKAAKRGLRSWRGEQYIQREAEKIFQAQGLSHEEFPKPAHEYQWIRDQIAPYKGPLERLGDATWRKYIAEPVWNQLAKLGDIPIPYRGKTITEAFQPAIERLRVSEPSIAKTIDQVKLSRQLVEDAMKTVNLGMDTLTPLERYEFQRGIIGRARSKIVSPRVKNILEQIDQITGSAGASNIDDLYANEFNRLFAKHLGDPLREVDRRLRRMFELEGKKPTAKLVDKTLQYYLNKYSQNPEASPKEIRKYLDEMINDPLVPEPIRKYGVQLANLQSYSPIATRKASMRSLTQTIGAKLQADPEAVSATPREGFVRTKHKEFGKDNWVLRDVELEMDALKAIQQYSDSAYQKWFLTPWKTNKVVLRPSAHFRNLYSNLILNDWGGLPFYRVDIYHKALRDMVKETPQFKEFHKMTAYTGRFTTEDVQAFISAVQYKEDMLSNMHRLFEHIAAPARALYGVEETWFKYAKYLHNLEKGMDKEAAALDGVKWTFNYGEITPAVAAFRSKWYGMPFFTWMAKSIPLFLETQWKYPLRVGKWWAFFYGLSSLGVQNSGLTNDEWNYVYSQLPDYVRNGIWCVMPWRDDKGQLKMLNLTWMLPGVGDIAELYGRGSDNIFGLAFQNPMINLIGTLQRGTTELGIPISYEWEPPATKLAKSLTYIWQWWAPGMAPGGLDWNIIMDAIIGRPDALTPNEAMAAQFGFRLKTVNPALVLRRARELRRIHQGEAKVMRQRELRNAVNDKERASILRRYNQILRDIESGGETGLE